MDKEESQREENAKSAHSNVGYTQEIVFPTQPTCSGKHKLFLSIETVRVIVVANLDTQLGMGIQVLLNPSIELSEGW